MIQKVEQIKNFQVDVACRAFHQETGEDEDLNMDDNSSDSDDGVSPREVKIFNII